MGLYYLWVVRDIFSGVIVYFMLSEVRSGLHVIKMLHSIKEIKVKILGKELHDYFLHDSLPAYNFLSSLIIKHDHETFELRNFIE